MSQGDDSRDRGRPLLLSVVTVLALAGCENVVPNPARYELSRSDPQCLAIANSGSRRLIVESGKAEMAPLVINPGDRAGIPFVIISLVNIEKSAGPAADDWYMKAGPVNLRLMRGIPEGHLIAMNGPNGAIRVHEEDTGSGQPAPSASRLIAFDIASCASPGWDTVPAVTGADHQLVWPADDVFAHRLCPRREESRQSSACPR